MRPINTTNEGGARVLITENQLDVWVRGNANDAQGVIVELVWRLAAASCPQPKERRFPLGDSVGQHGPDGLLNVNLPFDPFVPEGRSFWEIGTGDKAGAKATSDYKDLVLAVPEDVRKESAFIFVTPLSGRRDWEHTWKKDAQAKWIETRRKNKDWREVRVIDGTRLVDWIHQFPPVELWFAQKIGIPASHIETPEQRWGLVRTIGEPPPLTPKLFLSGRDSACSKLMEILAGTSVQLKLTTRYPDHVVDFVCAYMANLDLESRTDAAGRSLIVSDADAWNAMVAQDEPLILIADSKLDLSGDAGTKLIQKARRAGHAVIFGGPVGGIPDPASAALVAPQTHQVKEALEVAGYKEERARMLAQRSGGNLSSLLRCLQNLSLLPGWAESTAAAELAIAAALGSWSDQSTADRAIVEDLAGKSYGEWIGKMREVALRPGTPLNQRDGNWRFSARYEGWYALGQQLFDEHLQRFQRASISVLTEKDPQFELATDERFAASIHGKVLTHSQLLRNGLAEALALLGSHPKALTSCTSGKAELTAISAVRAILAGADWERWASLNDLLPLLAEAAPGEFLDAFERALNADPCPFARVFAEEGDGFMGRTYMSGVLWALETLAWDPDHLARAMICLGDLAARDPGGRWANRPAHSLTAILLPWFPQTCAPVAKRASALKALLAESPDVGWKLLVSLLPQSHSASSGTRKPAWRTTIPEEWSSGVTTREYREQAILYSGMAIDAAKDDLKKLIELVGYLESLPPAVHEQILRSLESDATSGLPEAARLSLWTELVDLISKHRKFSDAGWAMTPEQVDAIAAVAERLSPSAPELRHRRLFSERDFDLYDEKDGYEEQRDDLERRRQNAVGEIASRAGPQGVIAFAENVQSPWRVGIAAGAITGSELDQLVLPTLLGHSQKQIAQFVSGYLWSRFRKGGWEWADGIDRARWEPLQIGQFLSLLPFMPATWDRASRFLGMDEFNYWENASANPYETDSSLQHAIEKLIKHERPNAALRCMSKIVRDKQKIDSRPALEALHMALASTETVQAMDSHDIVEIIKVLQEDPAANPDELAKIEWAYLPLLIRHDESGPIILWRRLAAEPKFFCEVIQLVFKSKKETEPRAVSSESEKKIATNAYRLVSEWRIPPGQNPDGTFDGDLFKSWIVAVKKQCVESGHLEIAMTMLGHVLIHAPADPSGLWIHKAVAAALNAKDAEDMRNGYRIELYNSRGAHWVDPTGGPEKKLAAKYRDQAESVESDGYHRLATTLRELAESYDREAEDRISRGHHDD